MESRLIYASDETFSNKVNWIILEKNSQSEWNYLASEALDENKILTIFDNLFSTEKFYLVTDRKNSTEINKADLILKIKNLYGNQKFRVWDDSFETVIEFDKEVYRKGTKIKN